MATPGVTVEAVREQLFELGHADVPDELITEFLAQHFSTILNVNDVEINTHTATSPVSASASAASAAECEASMRTPSVRRRDVAAAEDDMVATRVTDGDTSPSPFHMMLDRSQLSADECDDEEDEAPHAPTKAQSARVLRASPPLRVSPPSKRVATGRSGGGDGEQHGVTQRRRHVHDDDVDLEPPVCSPLASWRASPSSASSSPTVSVLPISAERMRHTIRGCSPAGGQTSRTGSFSEHPFGYNVSSSATAARHPPRRDGKVDRVARFQTMQRQWSMDRYLSAHVGAKPRKMTTNYALAYAPHAPHTKARTTERANQSGEVGEECVGDTHRIDVQSVLRAH